MALAARLPTMYALREYVEAGGLMSYGPNTRTCSGAPPNMSTKFCAGAKPGDIPVEQPTKFDLVDQPDDGEGARPRIPPTLLARADEVIE